MSYTYPRKDYDSTWGRDLPDLARKFLGLEVSPASVDAPDTTDSLEAAHPQSKASARVRISRHSLVAIASITFAALATVAAYYFAKSFFLYNSDDVPTIYANFEGGERDPQGGFNEDSDCAIENVKTLVTLSSKELKVTANGNFDASNYQCEVKIQCYLKDSRSNVDTHEVTYASSSTANTDAGPQKTTFSGDEACSLDELTKHHPRILSVQFELLSIMGLKSSDPNSLDINTIYPFTTVASYLESRGDGKNMRVVTAMNMEEEDTRQLYIFVAAAVFGAAVASLFESVFSVLRGLIPRVK